MGKNKNRKNSAKKTPKKEMGNICNKPGSADGNLVPIGKQQNQENPDQKFLVSSITKKPSRMKTLITMKDIDSGDVMCESSFPFKEIYDGVCIEMTGTYTVSRKNMRLKGAEISNKLSENTDVVEELELVKINFSKEDFKSWSKEHLKKILEKFQEEGKSKEIARFKAGATNLSRFILCDYDIFTVYAGPSMNKSGSLGFAYQKNPRDTGPTFLYFSDGMLREETTVLASLQEQLEGTDLTMKEKKEMIMTAGSSGRIALIACAMEKLVKSVGSDWVSKAWFDFFSLYKGTFAPLPNFNSEFFDEEKVDTILEQILVAQFKTQKIQVATATGWSAIDSTPQKAITFSEDFVITGYGEITSAGSDESGEFKLTGQFSSKNEFKLVRKYANKTVICTGESNEEHTVLKGSWHVVGQENPTKQQQFELQLTDSKSMSESLASPLVAQGLTIESSGFLPTKFKEEAMPKQYDPYGMDYGNDYDDEYGNQAPAPVPEKTEEVIVREESKEEQQVKEITQKWKQQAFKVCQDLMSQEKKMCREVQKSEAREKSFTKTCIDRGFFKDIISILGQLTFEFAREFVAVVDEEQKSEDSDSADEDLVVMTTTDGVPTEVAPENKVEESPIVKKAGVGYKFKGTTQWNVAHMLKSREAVEEQIIKVLDIMKSLVQTCHDQEDKDFKQPLLDTSDEKKIKMMFLESSLLPVLEASLRAGSILEMSKRVELYLAYLDLIDAIATKQNLFGLLIDIGDKYQPRQKESLSILLKGAAAMSDVFLSCLSPDDGDEEPILKKTKSIELEHAQQSDRPKKLSERLMAVNELVNNKIDSSLMKKQSKSPEQILDMPLKFAFEELLKDFRVRRHGLRIDGKLTNDYQHHWLSQYIKGSNPRPAKLVRLAQEIADMSNALPVSAENSIFLVVDYQRADVMKAIIFGAEGTAYAHGAFLYDIFFPDSYPADPPKVNLMTTGGGSIRFNPNLYNCGKVCLSLLGTWGHDWQPQLSNLLQVLLSIQAIVMSNEIYFNEPGWTNEMGTPHGEAMNNGYKNLVRYANTKYAMIESLRNPPRGFEEVIRRHYFLKKGMIMKEFEEWIQLAKTEPAKYCGQNSTLDNIFGASKEVYLDHMIKLREELVVEFNKLDTPYLTKTENKPKPQMEGPVLIKVNVPGGNEVQASNAEEVSQTKKLANKIADKQEQDEIEMIDVEWKEENKDEENKEAKQIDVTNDTVKDRWSRYIGAMGIEAVAKQAEATVLLSGLGGLGVEIAKNLVLAGCLELILHDTQPPSSLDLSSQFFLSEKDIQNSKNNKNRAQLCKSKLQELNSYVKVSIITNEDLTQKSFFSENPANIKVAVFTDCFNQGHTNQVLIDWNEACRKKGIQMIVTDQNGVFSRILTDFGPKHVVIDKNGEPLSEVMIQSIEPVQVEKDGQVLHRAKIHLQQDKQHNFEEGDKVELTEVVGMEKPQSKETPTKKNKNKKKKGGDEKTPETTTASVNGEIFTIIEIINTSKFIIDCDTTQFSDHVRDGVAKQLKTRIETEFKPLADIFGDLSGTNFDQDLQYMDFEKLSNFKNASICYKVFGQNLKEDQISDSQALNDLSADERKQFDTFASAFLKSRKASLGPICAFIGGIVVQEIVKGITGKFMPIKQEFYFDAIELYDSSHPGIPDSPEAGHRYLSIEACLGKDLVEKIKKAKVFMIGAGAIGCELLKNFAMLGLGSGKDGSITLTDPDIIELSNLNRQFLFREKHLRKPKSMVAAAAAIQMNGDLKGHLSARLDKIHQETEDIYSEEFYKKQTLVANALDNVKARLFVDNKCVQARVPLLDSGTLGPKGHVQVVIPFKTETYGSKSDPEENNAIPHCTLKMFPEEAMHCVEWAKDLFGSQFSLNPQNFNKLKQSQLSELRFNDMTERKNIKKAIKIAEQQPQSFNECIAKARCKFQKLYHNDILQLIHVYPLDKVDATTGRPFWSLPKRPPTEQVFDPKNKIHRNFVAAYACLLAHMYGIKNTYDAPRSENAKQKMADFAATVKVKSFKPDDSKALEMQKQVATEDKEEANIIEEDAANTKDDEDFTMIDTVLLKKKSSITADMLETYFAGAVYKKSVPVMQVQEFEKDDDDNFHIDFIHAAGNSRVLNYGLVEMDWIHVKLKAGRIVPALATTTAAIAGLQTIELMKLIKRGSNFTEAEGKFKFEHFRNSFLNLAVPSLMLSEAAPPDKHKIRDDLIVDEWQRWEIEISKTTKLVSIVKTLEKKFKLQSRDVMVGPTAIFSYAFRVKGLSKLQQPQMKQPALQLIEEIMGEEALAQIQQRGFVDLTVTFVEPNEDQPDVADDQRKLVENIPAVRIILNSTCLLTH